MFRFRLAALAMAAALALLNVAPAVGQFAVVDAHPLARYVATAGQTVFPYTWGIYSADDLEVWKQAGGVGSWALLTKNVDYTVSGVGSSGGNVTLTTATAAGDLVELLPSYAYATGYTYAGGDITAARLNKSLNSLVQLGQENRLNIQHRALLLPALEDYFATDGDGAVSNDVPTLEGQAGRVLTVAHTERGVSWEDPDCDGTCVPDPLVFDVSRYGAVCDGSTLDTQAIRDADAAAAAAGGGVVSFASVAGKTCVLQQTNDRTPAVTVSGSRITYDCAGVTFKAATTDQPDSVTEEEHFAWAFLVRRKDHVTFRDCNFDGQRNAATDPRMGFVRFVQSDSWSVEGGHLYDVSNLAGAVSSSGYDCVMSGSSCAATVTVSPTASDSTVECVRDGLMRGVEISRAVMGFSSREGVQRLRLLDNDLVDLDIAAYYTGPPDMGWSFVGPYGERRILRGLRVSGFLEPRQCDISRLRVRNNSFRGSFGFELWNHGATYGQDPSKVRGVSVVGNYFEGFACVSLNDVSRSIVASNECQRLKLDAAGIADYTAGGGKVHGLTSTASVTGWGFELGPVTDVLASGNRIDCDNEGSIGISAGAATWKNNGAIVGNYLRGCYYGVRMFDSQDMVIRGNVFDSDTHGANALRVDPASLGADNLGADGTGNVFADNRIQHLSSNAAAQAAIVFQDTQVSTCSNDFANDCTTNSDCTSPGTCGTRRIAQTWELSNLDVRGSTAGLAPNIAAMGKSLTLRAADLRLSGFKGWAIEDAALSSTYDRIHGRSLVALGGSDAPHVFRFNVQANKAARVGTWTCDGCDRIAGWFDNGSAPAGQSYTFGTFTALDALQSTPFVTPASYGGSGSIPTVGDVRVLFGGSVQVWNANTRKAGFHQGTGSPEGVVTASPGSIYQNNSTGAPFWRKASGTGNSGWVSDSSMPNLSSITVAAGAIAPASTGHYYVDTEGAAATDDLDSITSGADGMVLWLSTTDSTRDVTVKNVASIQMCGGVDFVLDHRDDVVALVYRSALARWVCLFTANNS